MNNFSTKKAFNGAVTGIATFAKCDLCTDIRNVQADIAVLGAPFDIAIQGKPGARLGPRGIRQGSTRFSYKSGGSYDPERDGMYMDSDGLDAAQAPATGSPIFGGFVYDDITEILEAAADRFDIVGCDMVEVSPPYDDNAGTTCYLAARIVSDLLGFVCKARERRGVKGVLSC